MKRKLAVAPIRPAPKEAGGGVANVTCPTYAADSPTA